MAIPSSMVRRGPMVSPSNDASEGRFALGGTMPTVKRIPFNFEWDREMPLSQVVRAGDTLYLAGQVPLDEAGNVVGENDLEAQARQVFRNMQRVLAAAGAELSDVV